MKEVNCYNFLGVKSRFYDLMDYSKVVCNL